LSFFEPLLYRCSPHRQPALPHSLGYCQDTLLKMTQKQKALSKEEELLLQDFSRNVSTKSNALFYGNAFIVSAVPIWLFWRIHLMDPLSSSPFFLVITILSTYLVSFAYKNTKFVLKHKVKICFKLSLYDRLISFLLGCYQKRRSS